MERVAVRRWRGLVRPPVGGGSAQQDATGERGACGTYALSRLSNALLPFILLPVLAAYGPVAMFAVVSAAMVIVALDIGLLGPRSTGLDLESVNTAEAPISR